jgi:hypothetical protein
VEKSRKIESHFLHSSHHAADPDYKLFCDSFASHPAPPAPALLLNRLPAPPPLLLLLLLLRRLLLLISSSPSSSSSSYYFSS